MDGLEVLLATHEAIEASRKLGAHTEVPL
jgi:hypothetical protein